MADANAARVAELYDLIVEDWPEEMEFYCKPAEAAWARGEAVLEVACGTGRIAIRLAERGARVVGLDLSPAMLAVARRKSAGNANVRWVEGDMRTFELAERFGLALIPGHWFVCSGMRWNTCWRGQGLAWWRRMKISGRGRWRRRVRR